MSKVLLVVVVVMCVPTQTPHDWKTPVFPVQQLVQLDLLIHMNTSQRPR